MHRSRSSSIEQPDSQRIIGQSSVEDNNVYQANNEQLLNEASGGDNESQNNQIATSQKSRSLSRKPTLLTKLNSKLRSIRDASSQGRRSMMSSIGALSSSPSRGINLTKQNEFPAGQHNKSAQLSNSGLENQMMQTFVGMDADEKDKLRLG